MNFFVCYRTVFDDVTVTYRNYHLWVNQPVPLFNVVEWVQKSIERSVIIVFLTVVFFDPPKTNEIQSGSHFQDGPRPPLGVHTMVDICGRNIAAKTACTPLVFVFLSHNPPTSLVELEELD